MAGRTLAGSIGLTGDWDLGENNWKDANDLNLLKLSVTVQGVASELVSVTPGAPDEGLIVLFDNAHPTNPGDIAVYDEAGWHYITPSVGWQMFDTDSGFMRQFDGSTWVEVTSGGGGSGGNSVVQTEAGNYTLDPGDDSHYIRLTAAGSKTVSIDLESTTALPANGEWHFRNVGAGNATIDPDVGVTVNPPADGTLVIPQGGTITLKRVAADEFDLLGQTVAA
jgi:hypothetical protein